MIWMLLSCGEKSGSSAGGPAANETNGSSITVVSPASLPTCDASTGGNLAYILSDKTFRVCDKGQWMIVNIPDKSVSSGNDTTVFLYDANNRKIGYPFVFKNDSDSHEAHIVLSLLDGRQMEITTASGPVYSNTNFFTDCYYASEDCSGSCYQPLGMRSDNYSEATKNLHFAVDFNGGNLTIRLINQPTDQESIALLSVYGPTGVCRRTGGPQQIITPGPVYKTAAYNPTQFTYPFALPLQFKTGN